MSDSLIYGFCREIHEPSERLIATDIHFNDSMLIDDLLADELVWIDCFSVDQIENLYNDVSAENDSAAQPQEVFEWWRVSPFLAEELIACHEPVLRNHYGDWWGRACSGQSIILDGTIQRIVERWGQP